MKDVRLIGIPKKKCRAKVELKFNHNVYEKLIDSSKIEELLWVIFNKKLLDK